MRKTPGHVFRAETKADFSEAFSAMLSAEKVGQIELSIATGIDKSTMQRIADPGEKASLSLPDVVVIGLRGYPVLARRALRWASERLGLVVSERLQASAPADMIAHVSVMLREHSECAAAILDAAVDGEITSPERERIRRELADVESASASVRAWLDDLDRAGSGGEIVSIVGRAGR